MTSDETCLICGDEANIELTNNVMVINLRTSQGFGPTKSLIYYCENCFSKILQRWDLRDE